MQLMLDRGEQVQLLDPDSALSGGQRELHPRMSTFRIQGSLPDRFDYQVPQAAGPLTGSPNAGMVVYYIQVGSNIKAFPKVRFLVARGEMTASLIAAPGAQGFRMISGDPWLRAYDATIDDSRSILFRCLQSNDASGTGTDTHGLPTTPCPGGIRSQINFPTYVVFCDVFADYLLRL